VDTEANTKPDVIGEVVGGSPDLEYWTHVRSLTPDLYGRILLSYIEVLNDQVKWTDFLHRVENAYLFVGEHGWVMFEDIVPNGSASVHGAKWAGEKQLPRLGQGINALLDWFMDELKLKCLNATLPQRAKAAQILVKHLNFESFGTIPFCVSYMGVPEHMNLYVRFREVKDGK
jgi:hypothetical protein